MILVFIDLALPMGLKALFIQIQLVLTNYILPAITTFVHSRSWEHFLIDEKPLVDNSLEPLPNVLLNLTLSGNWVIYRRDPVDSVSRILDSLL